MCVSVHMDLIKMGVFKFHACSVHLHDRSYFFHSAFWYGHVQYIIANAYVRTLVVSVTYVFCTQASCGVLERTYCMCACVAGVYIVSVACMFSIVSVACMFSVRVL